MVCDLSFIWKKLKKVNKNNDTYILPLKKLNIYIYIYIYIYHLNMSVICNTSVHVELCT